jgi:hypothetical protein
MPTIDQLQAAVASSDTDELLASQSGDTRKVTRAQLLAGLQPAISVPPGALLGNSTSTAAAPLSITVGRCRNGLAPGLTSGAGLFRVVA